MENKQTFDISTSSIIRVVVVLLVIGFIFSIWQILASIFLAVVIASGVEPAVSRLTKIKFPRLLAALVVYTVGLLVLTSVFYAVLPTLIGETRQLSTELPEGYSQFLQSIERFFGKIPVNGSQAQGQIGAFFSNIQQTISGAAPNIFTFTFNLFGGLLSSVLLLIISFYLVIQRDGLEEFLKSVIPGNHQEYAVNLLKRVQKRLGRWFQGQLLLGIIAGAIMFLVLWLMGAKYALTLGFAVGVLEIIPVIGPMIAGVLMFALVSFQSPALALAAVIIYFVMEQVQQHLLVPQLMSKTMGLNPIVIIIVLLVAAKLIGFWGIILAIPLAVMISEFVNDFRR